MNIYRHRFTAPCPENALPADYLLEIRTGRTVLVEDILAAVDWAKGGEKPYHETMADDLYKEFGGIQRLVAFHHGVEIETIRGQC